MSSERDAPQESPLERLQTEEKLWDEASSGLEELLAAHRGHDAASIDHALERLEEVEEKLHEQDAASGAGPPAGGGPPTE